MRIALEVVFWVSAGLIVWTLLGYGAVLAALDWALPARARSADGASPLAELPRMSLIVAAHDEEPVDSRWSHSRSSSSSGPTRSESPS